MGKRGQYNYKGVNAQAWAAMSLFLQYLRYTDFSHIQLEAPKFEDFNLVFSDDHKIICESKDWKQEFNFSHLKSVLDSILSKTTIGEKDEILIICTELSDELKSKVENMKYWNQFIAPEFKKKKFSDQQIAVLEKVKFWKVQERNSHLIVYALFGELLNFWLPEDELECRTDSILIKRIYEGSAKGEIYRREDILNEIESIRKKASKYSGYFDDERVKTEIQLQNLVKAIENNRSPEWAQNQLSALSSKPALMFFALDHLKDKKIDNLKEWGDLWKLYKIYRFSFSLFRIFENNLHTEENKKYVLRFFKNNIGEIKRFYQHDFFDVDVVKITKKILEEDKDNEFIEDAFGIVKKLIIERRDDIFYLKSQQDSSWERGEVAKLLYDVYGKATPGLKEKIYELIIGAFNLIKDDGEFSHYTPSGIFDILENYLIEDWNKFEERLQGLRDVLVKQYEEYYKKFDGWELTGGAVSALNHNYEVSERHFVMFVIAPALGEYYKEKKDDAWKFILTSCISKTEGVSKAKPDFLNRAVISIVLDRYEDDNSGVSEEAFNILKEFISSRKGIPHKTDLIYQWLKHQPKLPDDKKWRLIEITTKKYGFPVSVFIEGIVSQLAKTGYQEAKNELKRWLDNPKYYGRFRIEVNIVQNIRALLDSDFDFAVELFETFIQNENFIKEYDSFETYELAALLYDILKENPDKGLEIIKKLAGEKTLTKNQQILLCFSLFNYRGNDKSDELDLLMKVYDEFLIGLLFGVSDKKKADTLYILGEESEELFKGLSEKICSKITFSQAREALAQFADRLVANKKIKEALGVIRVFVNDPDPYLPGEDPEDPENKYNEHQNILGGKEPGTITSVRGWCAWVLMKCAVPLGRDYIGEIIALTEQLAEDENWYVKHMACFALSQLAGNSLTVMPDNKELMFFGKDKGEALERAKRVQKIAFGLLKDLDGADNKVKDALAKSVVAAFDRTRALNGEDALVLIDTLKKFPSEAIAEAMPLFIYFAEFRQDHFKDWKWQMPGYYDDLGNFDNKPFQDITEELIKKRDPKINWAFAVEMEKIARELVPGSENEEKMLEIVFRYFNLLAQEYHHDFFNVIYMTIKDGIIKKNHFDRWYDLYKTCLNKEKDYYDKNFKQEKTPEMSWYPSYYNEDILALLYQQGEKDKFLEIFNIITQFPKELEIHDSEKTVSLLKEFPKTDTRVKTIIGRLYERNPSKYYELRNQWLA